MNIKQETITQKLEEYLLPNYSQEELLVTRNFIREIVKNKLKNSKETPKNLLEAYKKKFTVKNKRNKTSYDIAKEHYAANNIISEIKNSAYLLEALTNNKHALRELSGELQDTLSRNNKKNKEDLLLPSKIKKSSQLRDTPSSETESDYLLLNLIEEITNKLEDIKRTNKIKAGISKPSNFIEKLFSVLKKRLIRRKSNPKTLVVVNEFKQARSLKESKLLKEGFSSEEILDSFLNSYVKLNIFKDKNDVTRHNSEISDLISLSKKYLNEAFTLKLDIKLDDKVIKNVENFLQEKSDLLQEYLLKEKSKTPSNTIMEVFFGKLTTEAIKIINLYNHSEKSIHS